MNKVVISGATGFLGLNLCKLLSSIDSEFFLLSRKDLDNFPEDNVHYVKCDVLDPIQVKNALKNIRPSHLLHLAWGGFSPSDYNLPENFEWLKASINLLEEFQANGGQRAVMAGTCFEYNWDRVLCTEYVTSPTYETLYGASKNILKDYATAFSKHHNLELAWIRPFFLYGPHENPKRLLPQIIISLLKGEKAIIMNGEIFRDYMYVNDAVKIISKVVFSDYTGILNIATGIPIKLGEIGNMVAKSIGHQNLLEIRTPEVKNNRVIMGDTQKLQNAFQFDLTPIEKGLEETIDWWRIELSDKN